MKEYIECPMCNGSGEKEEKTCFHIHFEGCNKKPCDKDLCVHYVGTGVIYACSFCDETGKISWIDYLFYNSKQ